MHPISDWCYNHGQILFNGFIAVVTLWVIYRQTIASEAQANAAKAQVKSSESSQAVSEALLEATRVAANAEKRHSELIRYQILEALRPVIVANVQMVLTLPHKLVFRLENQGSGFAYKLRVETDDVRDIDIDLDGSMLGPGFATQLSIPASVVFPITISILYESIDGRFFGTTIRHNGTILTQNIDERGGSFPGNHPLLPFSLG